MKRRKVHLRSREDKIPLSATRCRDSTAEVLLASRRAEDLPQSQRHKLIFVFHARARNIDRTWATTERQEWARSWTGSVEARQTENGAWVRNPTTRGAQLESLKADFNISAMLSMSGFCKVTLNVFFINPSAVESLSTMSFKWGKAFSKETL